MLLKRFKCFCLFQEEPNQIMNPRMYYVVQRREEYDYKMRRNSTEIIFYCTEVRLNFLRIICIIH